jgi:hypothetical protein
LIHSTLSGKNISYFEPPFTTTTPSHVIPYLHQKPNLRWMPLGLEQRTAPKFISSFRQPKSTNIFPPLRAQGPWYGVTFHCQAASQIISVEAFQFLPCHAQDSSSNKFLLEYTVVANMAPPVLPLHIYGNSH